MSRNSRWRLENLHVAFVCVGVCVLGLLLFALAKPGGLRRAIKALFDSEESKQILALQMQKNQKDKPHEHIHSESMRAPARVSCCCLEFRGAPLVAWSPHAGVDD